MLDAGGRISANIRAACSVVEHDARSKAAEETRAFFDELQGAVVVRVTRGVLVRDLGNLSPECFGTLPTLVVPDVLSASLSLDAWSSIPVGLLVHMPGSSQSTTVFPERMQRVGFPPHPAQRLHSGRDFRDD